MLDYDILGAQDHHYSSLAISSSSYKARDGRHQTNKVLLSACDDGNFPGCLGFSIGKGLEPFALDGNLDSGDWVGLEHFINIFVATCGA